MNEDELYFKANFTKDEEKVNLDINKLNVECITNEQNNFQIDSNGNLKVNSIKTKEPLINELYPVGSIYMSIEETNPTYFFGGVWEQIKGRFLLGCGDNGDGWNYGPNSTGGEPDHRLTIDEMPSHEHQTNDVAPGLYNGWGNKNQDGWITQSVEGLGGNWDIGATGGNMPHNNLPPYLAVYIWKRIE